jgi:SRSO17 transposase
LSEQILKLLSRGSHFSGHSLTLSHSLRLLFVVILLRSPHSSLYITHTTTTTTVTTNVLARNQACQFGHAPELHRRARQIHRRIQIGMHPHHTHTLSNYWSRRDMNHSKENCIRTTNTTYTMHRERKGQWFT